MELEQAYDSSAFLDACLGVNVELVRDIVEEGAYSCDDMSLAFLWACSCGYLDIAVLLYTLGYVDIHSGDDMAFLWACVNGHRDIAHWLHSIDESIHHRRDDIIRIARINGHEDIVRWLISLDDPISDNEAFVIACSNGDKVEAFRLYLSGEIDYDYRDYEAFRLACINGHLNVVHMLCGLGDIPINMILDDIILEVRANGHEDIVEWFESR